MIVINDVDNEKCMKVSKVDRPNRVMMKMFYLGKGLKETCLFRNPPPPLYFGNISKIFPKMLLTEVTEARFLLINAIIFAVEQRLQSLTMMSSKKSSTT